MKEYTSNQRKKIVLKINKVKNKEILASKYDISIRTYYYWKRQLETCSIIKPKSTKPKTNKNKLKDKKIIKRIIEIRKLYGYGKFKIQKQLELEAIKVGTTAIETVLKENNLYRSKKKKIKRKHNGKHAQNFKEAGEKVQIDTKYAFFGEIRYYQITAVDLATRMTFRYLYNEKTPDNIIDFIHRMLDYFPFRVYCLQSDNGTEFTYRKHSFDTQHPLDIFCKKNYIKRVYSPVASPWYNGVVESTHNRDQKEFYDFCTQELTLEKANKKLQKYNHFWN
nr:DDE-type integrase/transposase/recombinase [Brachyspira pilosicoli]